MRIHARWTSNSSCEKITLSGFVLPSIVAVRYEEGDTTYHMTRERFLAAYAILAKDDTKGYEAWQAAGIGIDTNGQYKNTFVRVFVFRNLQRGVVLVNPEGEPHDPQQTFEIVASFEVTIRQLDAIRTTKYDYSKVSYSV